MFEKLLRFRYIMVIVVIIMLVSSLFFLIGGTVTSVKAYIYFIHLGLVPSQEFKAGFMLMNGLDVLYACNYFYDLRAGHRTHCFFLTAPPMRRSRHGFVFMI